MNIISNKVLGLYLNRVEIEHTLCLYSQEVTCNVNSIALLKTF